VLQFDYAAARSTCSNTPGTKDFSEDTTPLAAADNAVMLEDAQSWSADRAVWRWRMRGGAIFTFIKRWTAGREPWSLIDEIESELGFTCLAR